MGGSQVKVPTSDSRQALLLSSANTKQRNYGRFSVTDYWSTGDTGSVLGPFWEQEELHGSGVRCKGLRIRLHFLLNAKLKQAYVLRRVHLRMQWPSTWTCVLNTQHHQLKFVYYYEAESWNNFIGKLLPLWRPGGVPARTPVMLPIRMS